MVTETREAASFETHFSALLKARFPFLYVPTWEEERVLAAIRSVAENPSLELNDAGLFGRKCRKIADSRQLPTLILLPQEAN